jgi:hypothetical protein
VLGLLPLTFRGVKYARRALLRCAPTAAYSFRVRYNARRLDVGVHDVVTLLNQIPGVVTRASCEGAGLRPARHAHAALAYVALRHPMPLGLRDFLVARLGALARIEDHGIYSRWPQENRAFLCSLESATRLFLSTSATRPRRTARWPLARLRARLARQVAHGHPSDMRLCLTCAELVTEPHPDEHQPLTLLRLSAGLPDQWFAEFIAQPANRLDPALVASDGWVRLLARTQRGDFGAAFYRRWLRYRAHSIADLTTRQIRSGVDAARSEGVPIDFFHDGTHAVFAWEETTAEDSSHG